MPAGQPTKYDPSFCEKTRELMKEGASLIEIAYELNVSRSSLYNWMETHPEFLNTVKEAKDFSEGWWMIQGRKNINNKEFNSTLFYMNMKNRFKWSDRQESNTTVTVRQEDALKELE